MLSWFINKIRLEKIPLLCKKFFITEFQLAKHEHEWRTWFGGSHHRS